MSDVDLIREAANALRTEWTPEGSRHFQKARAYNLAVADWLDAEASCQAMYPDRDDDDIANALAVARAYLGGAT